MEFYETLHPREFSTPGASVYYVRQAGGLYMVMDDRKRPLGVAATLEDAEELAISKLDVSRWDAMKRSASDE